MRRRDRTQWNHTANFDHTILTSKINHVFPHFNGVMRASTGLSARLAQSNSHQNREPATASGAKPVRNESEVSVPKCGSPLGFITPASADNRRGS